LEDTDVDWRIILGCILGKEDWMHMVQDRDRWRALVNTVINIWVP
jgi:hypothetical protein